MGPTVSMKPARGRPFTRRSPPQPTVGCARASSGARVLLLGIRIPPNYGPQYTQAFGDIYSRLAKEKKHG